MFLVLFFHDRDLIDSELLIDCFEDLFSFEVLFKSMHYFVDKFWFYVTGGVLVIEVLKEVFKVLLLVFGVF